jgi:hypothetical protein
MAWGAETRSAARQGCVFRKAGEGQVAKAITYSLTRWDGLARFLDDGRLCMTNNAAERALRGIAVGRHNWTFAGSDAGGRRVEAMLMCQAEACHMTEPSHFGRRNCQSQRDPGAETVPRECLDIAAIVGSTPDWCRRDTRLTRTRSRAAVPSMGVQ